MASFVAPNTHIVGNACFVGYTQPGERDRKRDREREGKWKREERVGLVDGDDVVKSRKIQRIANGVYQFGSA